MNKTGQHVFDPNFLLLIALGCAAAGAALQIGLGVGFSMLAAPSVIAMLGVEAALGVLLGLNLLVSCIGMTGRRDAAYGASSTGPNRWTAVSLLAGVAIGAATLGNLPAQFLLAVTGVAILLGALSPRTDTAGQGLRSGTLQMIACTGGLITSWTATPGPIFALGLAWAGAEAKRIPRLIQPMAATAYGAAFALLGPTGWVSLASIEGLLWLLLATACGAIAGLWVRGWLPAGTILPGLRLLAVVGGTGLLVEALSQT